MKMKMKMKEFLLTKAVKYIRNYSEDSNYLKHADREFKLTFPESDEMQDYMCEQVKDILALLGTQGDSGTSICYKLNEDLLDLNELKSNFENMFNKKLFCELFINLNVLNTTDLNGNQIPKLKNILNLIAVKLSGLYPIEL